MTKPLNKEQRHIVWVMTLGGILEWFEIYIIAYSAPILGKVFFNFENSLYNILGVLLLFGMGFISRPFGAILFGRIGDLIGRKTAFYYSIVLLTIPTFLIGCLPTFSSIGIAAPILFYLLRFAQSIPASGESPGTICYLYENAKTSNRHYLTSWTDVGNQIGAILAIAETLLVHSILSEASLIKWGWRIPFWSGAALGLFGIYLRRNLMETPVFKGLQSHHHVDKETISEVVKNYKKPILLGVGYGAINAVIFYLFAAFIPDFIGVYYAINPTALSLTMIALLAVMTILIPAFGKLADIYSSKKILIFSSFFVIFLLPPLYSSIQNTNIAQLTIIGILFVLPIASITALYPYWIAHLFPAKVRYTAIGLSFNFADGIIGGLSPAIAVAISEITKNNGAFCWFVLLCSVISIISYLKIKENKAH